MPNWTLAIIVPLLLLAAIAAVLWRPFVDSFAAPTAEQRELWERLRRRELRTVMERVRRRELRLKEEIFRQLEQKRTGREGSRQK